MLSPVCSLLLNRAERCIKYWKHSHTSSLSEFSTTRIEYSARAFLHLPWLELSNSRIYTYHGLTSPWQVYHMWPCDNEHIITQFTVRWSHRADYSGWTRKEIYLSQQKLLFFNIMLIKTLEKVLGSKKYNSSCYH